MKTQAKKYKTRPINCQRRKLSCGPTALANAVKWLDCSTSHDAMVDFCKGIGTFDLKIGMYPSQFRYTLNLMEVEYESLKHTRTKDLDSALENGYAVLLLIRTKRGTHHAMFVDAKTRSKYRVWNFRARDSVGPWINRKHITDAIKRTLRHDRNCLSFVISPDK